MIQVNNTPISEQCILAEMQYHPADSQRSAMIKAAESLIISELLRQRAIELGVRVSEDSGIASDADFVEVLLSHDVKIPQATREECEQYFVANRQRFMSSPLLELQHILLAAPPGDDMARLEALQNAEQLIIKLQSGSSFEALAQLHSCCPSKTQGGDLGVISRGQTVPEFERQIMRLPMGLHLHPIESRYGLHLVKINRITPGKLLEFDDVQEKIATYLHTRVRHKAISQYIQQLISNAHIEGFDFSMPASPLMQ